MDTCSPECNTKRLECIYTIDPTLSSPTRWITNRTFRYDLYDSPKNAATVEMCEEEACFPESYHPGVTREDTCLKLRTMEEERVRPWHKMLRLKRFTFVMLVPITIILCKTLLSIII